MHTRATDLAAWLRERVAEAGARGLVFHLSGSVEAAVVARLCQMATPDHVLAMILPCHSDPADEADARTVAQHFTLPVRDVDLGPAHDALVGRLGATIAGAAAREPAATSTSDGPDLERARGDLQGRLRMAAVYFAADSANFLVAGTLNRSDLMIGSFIKYGDAAADLLPLGDLPKSEVLALARDMNVPAAIIDKSAGAGLRVGVHDEGNAGFTHAELERYVAGGPEAVSPALALRIERLIRQSEHKRRSVLTPDGTNRRSLDM